MKQMKQLPKRLPESSKSILKKVTVNARRSPLRADPTRTASLRRRFIADLTRRFEILKRRVTKLVVEEDAFGLKPSSHSPFTSNRGETDARRTSPILAVPTSNSHAGSPDDVLREPVQVSVANTRFKFHTTSQQVEAFRDWLSQQTQYLILGTSLREIEDAWWKQYVQEGYEKGAARAFDDTKKPRTSDQTKLDFFNGTKEQFLRESFAHPVSVDKVKLLAGRVYTEISGVTDAMAQRMVRSLTDGLVQGDSPREIARDLNEQVDGIGRVRSDMIARTEIIRAHADGQLNALRDLGVEQVGVMVEFSSTQDDLVCPECQALEGIVITIDEAEGQIPVHPNCRCAWIPANVGEDEKDQTRGKEDVDDAIEEANDAGADFDSDIDKDRPESVLNRLTEWFRGNR